MKEPSQRLKESSQEMKESSQRLKESSQEMKESSHDVKESSQRLKDSSQRLKDSSQRRFQLRSTQHGPEEALEGLPQRRQGRVAHVEENLASSSRLKSVVS